MHDSQDLSIAVLMDRPAESSLAIDRLRLLADCKIVTPERPAAPTARFDALLVDLDLSDAPSRRLLADTVECRRDTPLIMLTRSLSELPVYASSQRRTMLLSDSGSARDFSDTILGFVRPDLDAAAIATERSIGLADAVLRQVLSRDPDRALDLATLDQASEQLLDAFEISTLSRWLGDVKAHHTGTFLHCLTVAGLVAHFVNHLGFGRTDRARLLSGALVHDIGKAAIPLAILDKPSRLDEAEVRIMRTHADRGHRMLLDHGLADEMVLTMTRHHHELLDGTGYPDRLRGGQIPDAVRILTVCDVYAALIEERAYKRAFTQAEALDVLLQMRAELDLPLVKAFATSLPQAA